MANGPSVVVVFLVFAVLSDESIALRPPSPFRSLQFQAQFANGDCRIGDHRRVRGYVTLKDGRCFEVACAPGSYKVSFTLVERCRPEKDCWFFDGVVADTCCTVICA
ncbi:hypothetical protein MRX96_055823 [Rhipicephalus microplus]|uniref:Putative kDa family member n=1 Tax=Rhipicephalus microplus TaxID=6941 RepID=A0A6G5A4N3_RHIMP